MRNLRTDLRQQQYVKIRDCIEGEDRVKHQAQMYLPQPDGMSLTSYKNYLARASFYGAPEMTLRALTGLALRKDPVFRLPARLEPMRLRATNDKAPLSIMVEELVREVLAMGRYGIFLDFPNAGNTALTTPHFVCHTAETIEDWQVEFVDGQQELVSVTLASDEVYEGAEIFIELALIDGTYVLKRFLREGQQKVRVDIEEIVPTVGGKPLNFIPFLMISHQSIRPRDEKPPLLDLCNLALSHYRNSADREHAMFLTATPTPWIAGNIPQDKLPSTIGSGANWVLPEGTQVGYLEFTGASMQAFKDLMGEKLEQIASLGAQMLAASKNRNETTSTATQRTRSELSLLHSVVVTAESAFTHLLRIAAQWVGANPDEVQVSFSRDFIEIAMDPKMVEVQMKLFQSGAISRETFYANLQQGEIARADRSWEDEKELIEADGGDLSTIIPILKAVTPAA